MFYEMRKYVFVRVCIPKRTFVHGIYKKIISINGSEFMIGLELSQKIYTCIV